MADETKPEPQTAPETPATEAGTTEDCGCGEKSPRMPEVTFTTFVLSLASSGLVQLGEVPDPETGESRENLLMAKHTIDILSMLRSKTSGCLDDDEKKILDALLYELKMKYVLKTK